MRSQAEFESLKVENAKLKQQLARSKNMYASLCQMCEMNEGVISGQVQGRRVAWKMLEQAMHRGKVFFSTVMNVREMVRSALENDDGEAQR